MAHIRNKKGITPIMATLLLISFAVAVGVVIMNFGRAQVESEAQCAIEIGMKFSSIGGQQQICYNPSTGALSFTIENGINIKVNGLIVNVIGSAKAETFELNNANIGKAGTYLGNVKFAGGGQLRQVKITPKVVLYDEEQICSEKALISESIRPC